METINSTRRLLTTEESVPFSLDLLYGSTALRKSTRSCPTTFFPLTAPISRIRCTIDTIHNLPLLIDQACYCHKITTIANVNWADCIRFFFSFSYSISPDITWFVYKTTYANNKNQNTFRTCIKWKSGFSCTQIILKL